LKNASSVWRRLSRTGKRRGSFGKILTLFEEGMQLSATCRKQLEDAEGKVEILLKQNGKLQRNHSSPGRESVAQVTRFALGFGNDNACASSLLSQPRPPRNRGNVRGMYGTTQCSPVSERPWDCSNSGSRSLQHFELVYLAVPTKRYAPPCPQSRRGAGARSGNRWTGRSRAFASRVPRPLHRRNPPVGGRQIMAEAMSLGASDICEPRKDQVVHSLLNKRAHHAAA